jgi:hypothetical protein
MRLVKLVHHEHHFRLGPIAAVSPCTYRSSVPVSRPPDSYSRDLPIAGVCIPILGYRPLLHAKPKDETTVTKQLPVMPDTLAINSVPVMAPFARRRPAARRSTANPGPDRVCVTSSVRPQGGGASRRRRPVRSGPAGRSTRAASATMTRLRRELPGVCNPPLAVGRLKESPIDLVPTIRHRCSPRWEQRAARSRPRTPCRAGCTRHARARRAERAADATARPCAPSGQPVYDALILSLTANSSPWSP